MTVTCPQTRFVVMVVVMVVAVVAVTVVVVVVVVGLHGQLEKSFRSADLKPKSVFACLFTQTCTTGRGQAPDEPRPRATPATFATSRRKLPKYEKASADPVARRQLASAEVRMCVRKIGRRIEARAAAPQAPPPWPPGNRARCARRAPTPPGAPGYAPQPVNPTSRVRPAHVHGHTASISLSVTTPREQSLMFSAQRILGDSASAKHLQRVRPGNKRGNEQRQLMHGRVTAACSASRTDEGRVCATTTNGSQHVASTPRMNNSLLYLPSHRSR